jgi:hypothetical protein
MGWAMLVVHIPIAATATMVRIRQNNLFIATPSGYVGIAIHVLIISVTPLYEKVHGRDSVSGGRTPGTGNTYVRQKDQRSGQGYRAC